MNEKTLESSSQWYFKRMCGWNHPSTRVHFLTLNEGVHILIIIINCLLFIIKKKIHKQPHQCAHRIENNI